MDPNSHPDGFWTSDALQHPIRIALLRLLADHDSLSPAEAVDLLDVEPIGLSNVAYHTRVLQDLQMVEPAGELDSNRGAPYRATPAGVRALASVDSVRGQGWADS